LEAFDQHIDQRVAELNEQLQAARYAGVLFGDSDQLNVRVSSADNCVQIAVGAAEASASERLFPSDPAAAPIEIWLHDASIQEQSDRFEGPLALLSAGARTIPALQTFSLAAWQAKTPAGIDVRHKDGWLVLSYDSPTTNSTPPESRLARRSAN
jgi:hypothetical protein